MEVNSEKHLYTVVFAVTKYQLEWVLIICDLKEQPNNLTKLWQIKINRTKSNNKTDEIGIPFLGRFSENSKITAWNSSGSIYRTV